VKETEIYRNVIFLGDVNVNNEYNLPTSAGATGHVLTYNGSGEAVWSSLGSLSLTTNDVAEGISQYFTQERAEDVVGNLIQDGTGITWNYDDVANLMTGNVTLAPFSTINLAEGATALYFTEERVDDRVSNLIVGGTGINFIYDDGADTLTASIDFGEFNADQITEGNNNLYFTDERVDDRVALLIKDGTGITWSYNDGAGALTPTVTLAPFTTAALAEGATALYFTEERVDDRVSSLIIDSATVTWNYNDGSNTLSASAIPAIQVEKGGTLESTRPTLNFIEGTGISISVFDNGVNNRSDITINSTGSGGGVFEESTGTQSTIRTGSNSVALNSYNSVLAGVNNSASGAYHSLIVGGTGNSTSGAPFNYVIQGNNNTASGYHGGVLSGSNNGGNATYGLVLNGSGNVVNGGGTYSIVGGSSNVASSSNSVIFGSNNISESSYAHITGSGNKSVGGWSNHIINGTGNTADGTHSTILNGNNGTASGSYATVINGTSNIAAGDRSVVTGLQNRILLAGAYGAILNGSDNTVNAPYVIAAGIGNSASASANNSLVIGSVNTIDAPYTSIIGRHSTTAGYTGANIIGIGITANSENTTFVNALNLADNLTENNTEDAVLVRNNTTGKVETRDANTLSGVSVLEGNGQTVASGTGVETSLRTITIPANTLRTNGSAITVQLGGGFGSDSGSQDFRIKFNGNEMYAKNVTGSTSISEFDAKVVITRWNNTFIKAYTTMLINGQPVEHESYVEFSLDLTNNAYIIDITGESVAGSQVSIYSSLTTAMVV